MFYSRRINAQHRLVYMVDEGVKTVKIISMCGLITNNRETKQTLPVSNSDLGGF